MNEEYDDSVYDMSDEDLEAAFKEAKADQSSPEIVDEPEDTNDSQEESEVEYEDSEDIEEDTNDEEDLEQPDEDSDSDDSEEDDTEDEEDADSEESEEDLDGDPEPDEEQTDKPEDKVEDEPQPVQIQKFKANGRDYEFTQEDIIKQFPKVFGQAMDYTKKMQSIKPWRKTIDALEQAKMGHDDINLMIDVLKGDKDAITEVIKRTGTDAMDLDTENASYKPNDYGRDETTLAINEVVDKISADKEYETTHRVLSKDWDNDSWEAMTKDPNLIELLHVDVKSGMYDKVQPIADTIKLQDGGKNSDLAYYLEAGKRYDAQLRKQSEQEALAAQKAKNVQIEQEKQDKLAQVKAQEVKRTKVKKDVTKRKAAAPTAKGAGKKQGTDYLDDSDEAFDEWYQKLQDKI